MRSRSSGSGSSTELVDLDCVTSESAPTTTARLDPRARTLGRGRRLGGLQAGMRHEAEEDERKSARCAGCSLVAATIMTIWGIHLLGIADFARKQAGAIDAYNQVVDEWTDTYRAPFEGTTWALRVDDATEIPMDPKFVTTPLDPNSEKMAHAYDPLQFAMSDLLTVVWGPLPDDAGTPASDEHLREHSFTLLATRPGADAPEELPLGSMALLQQNVRRAGGWKVCKYQQGGYYHGGTCTTYSLLDSICVKATTEGEPAGKVGKWALDATFGGEGCRPGAGSSWAPVAWRHVRAPGSGGMPLLSGLYSAAVGTVTARSSRDPLVAAMHATKGSLFFAQKQAEEKATGIVLLMLGAALYIPGCVLGFPVARQHLKHRREQAKLRAYREVRADGLVP